MCDVSIILGSQMKERTRDRFFHTQQHSKMSHRKSDGDNNEMCVFTAHRGTEVSESFKNACFLRLSEDRRDISIMSVTPEV